MSAHLFRLRSSKIVGVAAVFALLAALLYATVLAAPAGARRQSGLSRRAFAEHLLKLDPGGRIGGDTIVGVTNGDLLLGVPHRVNFMVALGSGETVVGGNRADQLGALGKNATIHGGAGNDAIHGGPGHDVISGGAGNDLITDTKGSATINTGAGKNEVEVAGHPGRDRVLCAPGSVDRIFADHGDSIAPSCRKAAGSQVVYHQPPTTKPPTSNPDGCTHKPHLVDCTFLAASGHLRGFWASAPLAPYQCPAFHPFLIDKEYTPSPVYVLRGVELFGPGTDWFISVAYIDGGPDFGYAYQTASGSVTNWSFRAVDWAVWLHCSRDKAHGYKCPACGPKRPSVAPSQGSDVVSEKRKALRR